MLSVKLINTINPPMMMLTEKRSNSPYLLQSTLTKPIPNEAAAPAKYHKTDIEFYFSLKVTF